MSLKIDVMDNYPDPVKRHLADYNKGIETQDIMEVNIAIDGLMQLVFDSDVNTRSWSGIILTKIATLQPGFLKKGAQILLHRYKGQDAEKAEYASVLLGLLAETPAKSLIADPDLLKQIIEEHTERLSKQKFEDEQKKEFLEKVQQKQINFIGVTGEFLHIGQYYSTLIIDEKVVDAQKVIEDLIQKTIDSYGSEDKPDDFEQGCLTFSIIAIPQNREPIIPTIVRKILQDFAESKKKQKDAYNEFIINTIKSIQDLLDPKLKQDFLSIAFKRSTEKKKESVDKIKHIQQMQKLAINIEVTWEKQVKEIANNYNECLKSKDEKEMSKCMDIFRATLLSKDPYISKSSIPMYSQILEKNYSLVENFTKKMIKDYKKPEIAIILEENLDFLSKKGLLEKGIKNLLEQDKAQREAKEKEEKEKLRKELERREKIKVAFSGQWDKRLLDLIETINRDFLNQKVKNAEKTILGTMKNYIYAEDKAIAKQAIEFLNNVAKKYPNVIQKIMKELLDLFKSEHEMRAVAIDLLGLLVENPNKEILFKDVENVFFQKFKEEFGKRQEDIKQSQLMDKWDAIKLDVTTIKIDEDYDKKLQKVARSYNDGIQAKDKKKVLENVQIIVDWFLNEKNDERLNHVIDVLGKIAKQNIELIAPAIDMFMKMVDSKDADKKFRAIKGLGEVAVSRPGWAYQAIDKLVQISASDENETARMKGLIELSRVAKKSPTMLMEHIGAIINALKDPNKHVRRLCAFTLGNMAEAIPLEAQEAIPALREALHDDYFLVRQFADKALKLIRAAMRK